MYGSTFDRESGFGTLLPLELNSCHRGVENDPIGYFYHEFKQKKPRGAAFFAAFFKMAED